LKTEAHEIDARGKLRQNKTKNTNAAMHLHSSAPARTHTRSTTPTAAAPWPCRRSPPSSLPSPPSRAMRPAAQPKHASRARRRPRPCAQRKIATNRGGRGAARLLGSCAHFARYAWHSCAIEQGAAVSWIKFSKGLQVVAQSMALDGTECSIKCKLTRKCTKCCSQQLHAAPQQACTSCRTPLHHACRCSRRSRSLCKCHARQAGGGGWGRNHCCKLRRNDCHHQHHHPPPVLIAGMR